MSKFDEQREEILGEIGELGGFGEAEKTASADEDADEDISTEKLAETLGKMADDMPGEDGEVGDGTNIPNEENVPSGESSKNDDQESGVTSGESALNDNEQSGVPSGESAGETGPEGTAGDDNNETSSGKEEPNTPTQEADGATGEDPNKDSETTEMQDVKDQNKQAEEDDSEGDDSEEDSDEDDSDEKDSDEDDSEDSSGMPEEVKEKLQKKSAREEIETDIIEGALSEALRGGLGKESVEQFTEKIANFRESESTEVPSISGSDSNEEGNRFSSALR